ncbi:hypothetical protein DESA109040_05775 [Deinococcus saxicola]|uniref:hypothetical protein n=1 Tax=Deinococcus saxicola TaxID=249406 RepID=UPI0039EF3D8F
MFTRFPNRGTRVAEVLDGTTVERLPVTRVQPDYEVIRFKMTPISPGHEVAIAQAIRSRQSFNLLRDGSLMIVSDSMLRPLPRDVERRVQRMAVQTYDIELRFSTGRTHPRIYSLSPVINKSTRPKNTHLFRVWHPEFPDAQALCVYPPHLIDWDPHHDDPYDLLVWIATYLACDAIQVATGEWLGPEASHDIKDIRKYGNGKCWCGTGRPLHACHPNPPTPTARSWRHQ